MTDHQSTGSVPQNGNELAAVDPFGFDKLRNLSLDDIAVDRIPLTVPVRKPGRNEFFRVHPDPQYTMDSYLLEHEEGFDRTHYWVVPELSPAVEDVRATRLYTCVSRRGVCFLWPAKLPKGDNAGRRWMETGLEIAERAKKSWIRMRGNRDLGAYEAVAAKGYFDEPAWPSESLEDLIRLAFKGRIISDLDHHVLKALRGDE